MIFFKRLCVPCFLLVAVSLFVGCNTPEELLSQTQANEALERTIDGATIKEIDHDRWRRVTLITLADGRTIRIKSENNGHTLVVLSETTKEKE